MTEPSRGCAGGAAVAGVARGRFRRVARSRRPIRLDVPVARRATKIELDPTIGGRLRIDIEEKGVPFAVTGSYVELDRPRRISFTWSVDLA